MASSSYCLLLLLSAFADVQLAGGRDGCTYGRMESVRIVGMAKNRGLGGTVLIRASVWIVVAAVLLDEVLS